VRERRAVAQLGSALEWGSRGRWFESSQPDSLSGWGTGLLLLYDTDVVSSRAQRSDGKGATYPAEMFPAEYLFELSYDLPPGAKSLTLPDNPKSACSPSASATSRGPHRRSRRSTTRGRQRPGAQSTATECRGYGHRAAAPSVERPKAGGTWQPGSGSPLCPAGRACRRRPRIFRAPKPGRWRRRRVRRR
jgi:hypothetical protein